ncbi:unknown [Bacteroides sp. CAG:754]|nr:unknown [Bacteroides sp. CAG:754]
MRKNNKNERNNNKKIPLNKKLTTGRIFFHYKFQEETVDRRMSYTY